MIRLRTFDTNLIGQTHLESHRHDPGDVMRLKTSTPWTPGVGPAVTDLNFTEGNGTVLRDYIRVEQMCLARWTVVFGSTTAITGTLQFGLPFPAVNNGANWGNAAVTTFARDASAGNADQTGGGLLVDIDANGHVMRCRPYIQHLGGSPHVELTTSGSISSGITTAPVWTAIDDQWDMHTVGANHVVIPADGLYAASCFIGLGARGDYLRYQLQIANNTKGRYFGINGLNSPWTGGGSVAFYNSVSGMMRCHAGDVVQVLARHDNTAGIAVAMVGGSAEPKFTVARMGFTNDSALVTATHPFTWAVNDLLSVACLYEIAPGY